MNYEVVIGNYFSSICTLKFLVLSNNLLVNTGPFIFPGANEVLLPDDFIVKYIEKMLEHEVVHLLLYQLKLYKATKQLDNLKIFGLKLGLKCITK